MNLNGQRRMRAVDLADWLIDHGFAEERAGYGHATGVEIAEALMREFWVLPKTEAEADEYRRGM